MMNKGMLLKEWYAFKRNTKSVAFVLLVFGVMLLMGGNAMLMTYVNSFLMLMGFSINLNSMAEDEKYKWDAYGLTLPVSRKEVIRSKYLFTGMLALVCLGVMAVLNLAVQLLHGINFIDSMAITIAIVAIMLVFQSILIPLVVKIGSVKARIYIFALMGAPFVIFVLLMNFLDEQSLSDFLPSGDTIAVLVNAAKYVVPVILLVIMYISYRISVSIFNKKEF